MDITHDFLNKYGRDIIESKMDVAKKIDFKLGKAIDTLGKQILVFLILYLHYNCTFYGLSVSIDTSMMGLPH